MQVQLQWRLDQQDGKILQQKELLDVIREADHQLAKQIDRFTEQGNWSAVHRLYRWVCDRVADCLDERLHRIKISIHEHCVYNCPPYNKLTKQELEQIQSCKSVKHIMQIVGISEQWLNISCLVNFFSEMADPMVPKVYVTELWLDRYKQLLQHLCCKVLLRNTPDDHELLQELRRGGAETSLLSSRVLAVIQELDYQCFDVAQLLKEKECLEKLLNISPGHLKCIRVESGHSVAIYWLIDKRHIARVMLDGRWIFWPLLEHHVTSLELVGSLTLSLKGGHVPYLIRDALLTGQNLIQQTEVIITTCIVLSLL